MAEYIEREAVKKAFEYADADVCEDYGDGFCDWGFGRKNVNEIINAIPTADIAPMNGKEILSAALETYGADMQTLMMMEETAELVKELCKHARGANNTDAIAEEIADVQIMLDQMMILHNCENDVKEWRMVKLNRLACRLKGVKM